MSKAGSDDGGICTCNFSHPAPQPDDQPDVDDNKSGHSGCTLQKGKAALDAACSGDTDKTRDAVSEDAGPTCPAVTANEFLDIFLPKVPVAPELVNNVVHWVKHESGEYVNGRWKTFTKDPADYIQGEAVVFAKLCAIVNAIHKAVKHCIPDLHDKLQTRYLTKPSKAPETTFRYNLTRPDGYFVAQNERSQGKANPDWIDLAVTGEFKKDDTPADLEDDVQKALWNMHHVLREDPQRRHTFAFTIENRTLRMWFASRSEIVVSEPVDFFKDPKFIIRFFFAFMYASTAEMGWDPTMKLLWEGDPHVEPQYEITVQSKEGKTRVFRTIELVSAVGAESIRGRGTRVWKVREVDDGELSENYYVLKDAWVDSDRPSEGEVVAQIEKDAKKELDEREQKILMDCLLTTHIAGSVMLGPDKPDSTIDGRRRTRLIKGNARQFELKRPPKPPKPPVSAVEHEITPQDVEVGATAAPTKTKPTNSGKRAGSDKPLGDHRESGEKKAEGKSPVYNSKTHYRIVFKEVCEVLHEIKSLERIVWALVQACFALKALHKLGWVHRDISSGNLMVQEQQLKIADFEYAKKMTKPGPDRIHDIRTGTEDFMSVEVRSQSYQFLPETGQAIDDSDAALYARLSRRVTTNIQRNTSNADTSTKHRTWFYNPLHDYESIFWLTFNFCTNKDFHCIPAGPAGSPLSSEGSSEDYVFEQESEEQRRKRLINHWNFGRSLFSGRSGRLAAFCVDGSLANFLDESPLHPALKPLAQVLINMRFALVSAYRRIEVDPSKITHESASEVPRMCARQLLDAHDHLARIGCRLEVRSLKQAVDSLPKSYQDQRADAPPPPIIAPAATVTAGPSASSSTKRRRKKFGDDDDDEYVDGNKRKSKSPRTSIDHKSPTSLVPKPTKSAISGRGKQRGGKSKGRKAKVRKPRRGQDVITSAPSNAHPPPPQADPEPEPEHPPPPPKPHGRVLRSHTRKIVNPNSNTRSEPPLVNRTRKATTASARKNAKGAAKAKETATDAAKIARKTLPKTRTRKGRGG